MRNMDSTRKMNWHSSTISLNASSITGSQTSTRSAYRPRDPLQIRQADETKEKLEPLMKGIHETSAENNAFIKDSMALLKALDIEPRGLSPETTDRLDKVSLILKTENLASPDETLLTISRNRRRLDGIQTSRIDRNLKRKYEDLCSRYARLEEKVNNAQERVNFITDFVDSARECNEREYSEIIHKATKLNEYRETARNLENELARLDVADVYPDRILEKYSYYLGATGELAELNKIVNQYGELPADILQAKAAVEQKEKRRLEVKNLLDERMMK
ncbi:uncharacterized protein LOC107038183 isoform X2 [Diachasma alloeum]|uniref:uncharacterized protein LOC107038183 isoform X1 n=1 Tax=Diachasma alloeum TaxID=454923 RepID=UPI0007381DE0|nr:uncharacterized protein LOC107038183 isoform X1 [Diachasma alloeum]XP_015112595.1 uncharacterized protein LOC107038183 isoform X1 [Diachasma alloeum]XP_015112596.1 uncharacterized protein LOC107038183 isoform X1 [Diachasma alloeum]XP_015112597.1 uncharacterized protein LOC107038183 isoform X2 [Diachasma alloeum]